jgi:hypothetical protein
MNVKMLLKGLDEDECLVLFNPEAESPAVFDSSDEIVVEKGVEYITLQVPGATIPVPVDDFDKAIVMKQLDFMLFNMQMDSQKMGLL